MFRKSGDRFSEKNMRQRNMARHIPLMLASLAALFLVAPLAIIVPMSFSTAISFEFPPPGYWTGYYHQYFANHAWLEATANSFVIALGSMVFTLLVARPAAFGFVRYRFRGKSLLNLLLMLPIIVPAVVSALGYYSFLSLGYLVGTYTGMIIAHSVLSVPIAFLVISAALKGFDRNLERAAMSAGAGPLRTFFWVTLPVLRPGILVGALFAFLHSFNEAVVAIFIAGRDASTLPKKMFESIRLESDPVIAVVSTLLTGAVFLGVLVSLFFRQRSPHAA
jgi:putative spermidine/putrescine transport system permease protein